MKKSVLKTVTAGIAFMLTAVLTYAQGNGVCTGTHGGTGTGVQSTVQNQIKTQARNRYQIQTMKASGSNVCNQSANGTAVNGLQTRTRLHKMDQSGELLNNQNRVQLRNSLTEEQKTILVNKNMSREEKRNAFMNSLSAEQRIMLGI